MDITRLTARALPRVAGAAGAATLVLAALAGPAAAAAPHPSSHGDRSAQVTEDNDGDGVPNNVADGGDNRHPSGRDRSVEQGGSGNQGRSPSNPDGGAVDKPGGSGGVDVLDQDGNNGCGNDDDFEDDNNGRCGGLREKPAATHAASGDEKDADVASTVRPTASAPAVPAAAAPGETITATVEGMSVIPPSTVHDLALVRPQVLGADSVRQQVLPALASFASPSAAAPSTAPAGSLPRTGMELGLLAALGSGLVGAGALVSRRARRQPLTQP